MTEAEWLSTWNSMWLVEHLRDRLTERQSRLFACACVRHLGCNASPSLLAWGANNPGVREALAAEDSPGDPAPLDRLLLRAGDEPRLRGQERTFERAASAVRYLSRQAALSGGHRGTRAERAAQCPLLRDIVPEPFRPVPTLDPAWLSWRDGTVVRLAEMAYHERELPSGHLFPARLALVADALEDSGCDAADLLAHLRSAGPHVRGCWPLDLLLMRK